MYGPGCLTRGCRTVIPLSLRARVMFLAPRTPWYCENEKSL